MFTDADIEQAEWEELGNAHAAARRAGRCTHTSVQGANPVRAPHLAPGASQCVDCGEIFASDDDWMWAMDEALQF